MEDQKVLLTKYMHVVKLCKDKSINEQILLDILYRIYFGHNCLKSFQ